MKKVTTISIVDLKITDPPVVVEVEQLKEETMRAPKPIN